VDCAPYRFSASERLSGEEFDQRFLERGAPAPLLIRLEGRLTRRPEFSAGRPGSAISSDEALQFKAEFAAAPGGARALATAFLDANAASVRLRPTIFRGRFFASSKRGLWQGGQSSARRTFSGVHMAARPAHAGRALP